MVKAQMHKSLAGATLLKVARVQNIHLWEYYCLRRERMIRLSDGKDPNVVSCWHGTSKIHPSAIYEDDADGFMMQYAAAGMWGRGIYFADKAAYSHSYAHVLPDGSRTFMMVKLLAGEEVDLPSNSGLKIPPDKPAPAKGRFDTVTGTTKGSKVYIVYENGRAFPEYLVTYKTAS